MPLVAEIHDVKTLPNPQQERGLGQCKTSVCHDLNHRTSVQNVILLVGHALVFFLRSGQLS